VSTKDRLGKGLESLIPTDIDDLIHSTMPNQLQPDDSMVRELEADKIKPNPHQPRAQFDSNSITEMANSIKAHGIIQPLIVVKDGDQYQLIAGERRLRGAKQIGLKTVPAIVRSYEDQHQLELALIENIQRSELTPLELAVAYAKLIDQFNMSIAQISKRVGKAESTVKNIVRLLNLSTEAKKALQEGHITEGHARTLLSFTNQKMQVTVLEIIIKRNLNVRQAEELARKFKNKRKVDEQKVLQLSESETKITNQLGGVFNTKVSLQKTAHGGKLVIEYGSDKELDKIVKLILE